MNKRTRNFLVGSATVVMLGLSVGLVAFYNGGLPLSSSNQASADLAYLPADAAVVGYANVREVMDSEFRQKLMAVVPAGGERDEFLQHTGIDIERDVDSVMAASSTAGPEHDGVVLVRGRFNDGQIEGLIRGQGGVTSQYQGVRLVVGDPDTMGENVHADVPRDVVRKDRDAFALAFLDTGFLAVGTEKAVKAAIDAKASGKNATNNESMMKYINEIQAGQSAWAVGRFDAVSQIHDMPDQVKQHLPAVQWFSVSTRINGGVAGTLRADAVDDAAAENLRDVVRGGLAMGRLFSGDDPKAKMLIDSLQMAGTGKTVTLSFRVSPEMIDALAGLATMANDEQKPSVEIK